MNEKIVICTMIRQITADREVPLRSAFDWRCMRNAEFAFDLRSPEIEEEIL